MRSQLFTLAKSDFVKAGVLAVLVPVVSYVYQHLSSAENAFDIHQLGKIALSAFFGYLLKNFLTTSEGKFVGVA
jgi:hypothetical protein